MKRLQFAVRGSLAGFHARSCTTQPPTDTPDQVITPWSVTAKGPKGIDYERVRSTFKSEEVTPEVVSKFAEAIAKKDAPSDSPVHQFLRRGIAFSHRGLEDVLTEFTNGRRFYLYTGRGPSAESMHIGHAIPFMLTQYLQEVFNVPLVIQLTDDEKFLFRDIPLERLKKVTTENIKDILAFGFDPAKTFVFRNTEYMGTLYPTALEVQRLLTANTVKNTLGLTDSDNVGKYSFPAIQAAPCFVSSFPKVLPMKSNNVRCLIPCAIDQDPFFVLTRNISDRMKRPRPSLIHTTFLPSMKGATHKMSSSGEQHGVVLLSDDDKQVKSKLSKAFSGGRGTLEELKEFGPDLDADVAFQLLRFFEPDDAVLADVERRYGSSHKPGALKEGEKALTSGDVKAIAAQTLCTQLLQPWRERRNKITDEDVQRVCEQRPLW